MLLGAPLNVHAADIDIKAFIQSQALSLRQTAERRDIEAQACVYDAVRRMTLIFRTITRAVDPARVSCTPEIRLMLQAYNIPEARPYTAANEQQKALIEKWMYPAVKRALESFNQGLTDGWPDDLPEGVKLNDFVINAASGAKPAEPPANFDPKSGS